MSGLKAHVDDHFHEFKKRFEPGQIIDKDNVAKDFCKFMSAKSADGTRLLQLSDRLPQHIQMLGEVMRNWQGSGEHAAWLIVQSAFDSRIPPQHAEERQHVDFRPPGNDGGEFVPKVSNFAPPRKAAAEIEGTSISIPRQTHGQRPDPLTRVDPSVCCGASL